MFQPWHFTWTSDKQRLRGRKLLKNVAHVRPIVSKQFGGGQGTGSGVKELCRHIPNSLTGWLRQLHQASASTSTSSLVHIVIIIGHIMRLISINLSVPTLRRELLNFTQSRPHTHRVLRPSSILRRFFVCSQLPNKIFSCWESLTSLQTRFFGLVVSLCSLMRQMRCCQVSCACVSPISPAT